MRLSSAILALWLVLLPAAFGGSPGNEAAKLFALGNSAYQQGDYGAAERHFQRILDLGIESGPVYYNLGNACFKQNKLGQAVYCWEKARRRMPGDRDVRENLELAALMVVDRIEPEPEPVPVRLLSALPRLLSVEQESRLALILFVAASMLFSIYLLIRKSRALAASLLLGALFVLSGCSLAWKIYDSSYRKEGVVVEQKVDVRSGPGTQNTTLFTIHEGTRVRIHAAVAGWHQVSLPNGWSGWIDAKSVWIL